MVGNEVQEKFNKVKCKFRPDANYYLLLDYLEEVNANLNGGGGDVSASDVSTDDGSNVQVKLDDLDGTTSQNTTDIATNSGDITTNAGDIAQNTSDITTNTSAIAQNTSDITTNAGAISNLDTTGVASLRGGTVKELIDYIERYSLLTVFLSTPGTANLTIVDGQTTNIIDFSWTTVTETPSIEGGGQTFDGNIPVEWQNIYTETGVGTGEYTGSIIDATGDENSNLKMPDAELQTNGLWKSYGLDISVRVDGEFQGSGFGTDILNIEFTDGGDFSTNSVLLNPAFGSFTSSQVSLVSRIDKTTSQLIENGLKINITPEGGDFTLKGVDILIKIHH